MANEITLLDRVADSPSSRNDYHVLFLYTPTTPHVVGGTNVVPTPTTNAQGDPALPALATQALSQQELTDLNGGDIVYEIVTYTYNESLTPAQNLAAIRAIYANREARFQAWYAKEYEYAGDRYDAV
jgi:hypothetical protein